MWSQLRDERGLYWKLAHLCEGAGVVGVRLLFEMRWLILLLVSSLALMKESRANAEAAHCRIDTSAVCAGAVVCVERLKCVAESELALKETLGLDLTDHVEQVVLSIFGLLLLINLSALVAAGVRMLTDAEWLAAWRSEERGCSDVALCYRIIREYTHKSFSFVRNLNLVLYAAVIVYGSVTAYARGTLVEVNSNIVAAFSCMFAAYKLWMPEPRLTVVPFHIYAKRLPENKWFSPVDFLSSAPTLLLEKLTHHAREEEYEEMKEELRA